MNMFRLIAEHMAGTRSLRSIEAQHGIANGGLSAFAKRRGLRVRSRKEQVAISNVGPRPQASGANHWRVKNPETAAKMDAFMSRRRKTHNPMRDDFAVRAKRAVSIRSYLLATRSDVEVAVGKRLPEFVPQYPIGGSIVDFAHLASKVALEIDGRGHASRRRIDRMRDEALGALGWTIVRVPKDGIFDMRHTKRWCMRKTFETLEDLVPGLQLRDRAPSFRRQHWVIVREPNKAERRL